ncbi:MAG TPA: hypothetical protein PKA90_01585 [Ignavibacteria bacterium]|nr:hypothetical protein [Ignavibacteria bacterium]
MSKLNLLKIISFVMLTVSMSSCINVNQKTKINKDMSGEMVLHYWSPTNFVDIGDINMGDDIAGFSYMDSEIKKKYSSGNMEITNMRRVTSNVDTTTHIEINIVFKDINKLPESNGFANIEVSYAKGKDGMDFRYFIPKDTSIRLNYVKDINTLEYIFEFPDEVISTNGTIEPTTNDKGEKINNQVRWKFQVSDHASEDFELTATVKESFSVCGLFGIELPVIFLFGMVLMNSKRIFRKNIK